MISTPDLLEHHLNKHEVLVWLMYFWLSFIKYTQGLWVPCSTSTHVLLSLRLNYNKVYQYSRTTCDVWAISTTYTCVPTFCKNGGNISNVDATFCRNNVLCRLRLIPESITILGTKTTWYRVQIDIAEYQPFKAVDTAIFVCEFRWQLFRSDHQTFRSRYSREYSFINIVYLSHFFCLFYHFISIISRCHLTSTEIPVIMIRLFHDPFIFIMWITTPGIMVVILRRASSHWSMAYLSVQVLSVCWYGTYAPMTIWCIILRAYISRCAQ